MENKYFYCYSKPLKDFLLENGLRYVLKANHDKTKKMYLESKAKLEALEELITSNISDNEINIFLEVMNKMQENLMKKGNN